MIIKTYCPKLIAFCILFLSLLFFAAPILAAPSQGDLCIYPESCLLSEGATDIIRECHGRFINGTCQYHAAVSPDCTPCGNETSASPSATLSPTITKTPQATLKNPTSEEQAVSNLNQGLLPQTIIPDPLPSTDSGFLSDAASFLTQLLNPFKFLAQSTTIHTAYLPNEIIDKKTDEVAQADSNVLGIKEGFSNLINKFLGGQTGYYGTGLPDFVKDKDLQESEKLYEKANFPEGINPITKK